MQTKDYTLIFAFSDDLDTVMLRKMPDGANKGLLNGIGGRIRFGELVADARRRHLKEFTGYDSIPSDNIQWLSNVTMKGCTPDTEEQIICLHVYAVRLPGPVVIPDDSPFSDQVAAYDAVDTIYDSAERAATEIAQANPEPVYVKGLSEMLQSAEYALSQLAQRTR